MYKLEDKDRLKIPKLSNFCRTEFFDFNISKWNITDDVSDNDFNPLVNLIIDSNKGINIDGCAGSGKSSLINMLKNKLDNKEIEYITLAPTNKAAGIVGGQTIHKYISSQSRKSLTASKISYIFIDEISMIPEYFYKFFIIV